MTRDDRRRLLGVATLAIALAWIVAVAAWFVVAARIELSFRH